MQTPDSMTFLLLQAGTGLFWTITYVLILKRSFRDKTFGMPIAALCANISWEFIYSFVFPHEGLQLLVNISWLVLDVLIAWQYLRYGKEELDGIMPRKYFYAYFAFSLIAAFAIILTLSYELNDFQGKYAAFSQNLMMSILFIFMLSKRNSVSGQSMYIAISKAIGSFLPAVAFYLYYTSPLLNLINSLTFIFDVLYIVLLYNMFRRDGLNPWNRRCGWVTVAA